MQPNSKFLLNMETKEYFEKVMQDFNQNRKGRNLRKYCNDEGIDYKWLSEYKRTYGATKTASTTKNNKSVFFQKSMVNHHYNVLPYK